MLGRRVGGREGRLVGSWRQSSRVLRGGAGRVRGWHTSGVRCRVAGWVLGRLAGRTVRRVASGVLSRWASRITSREASRWPGRVPSGVASGRTGRMLGRSRRGHRGRVLGWRVSRGVRRLLRCRRKCGGVLGWATSRARSRVFRRVWGRVTRRVVCRVRSRVTSRMVGRLTRRGRSGECGKALGVKRHEYTPDGDGAARSDQLAELVVASVGAFARNIVSGVGEPLGASGLESASGNAAHGLSLLKGH